MKYRIVGHGEKTRYYIGEHQVTKKEFDVALPNKKMAHGGKCSLTGWAKPILSDAMAVHPEQIPEVMERNKKHGIFVEYEGEYGRPILRSRKQRRDLMQISGFHDNNAGYGDDHHTPTVKLPEKKIMKGL